jgi:hypothetical protein
MQNPVMYAIDLLETLNVLTGGMAEEARGRAQSQGKDTPLTGSFEAMPHAEQADQRTLPPATNAQRPRT